MSICEEKKQRGFTLLEFIIILAIFNSITLIIVPVYQNTMKHKAWAKTMVATTPLKQAIAKCLHDRKGDVSRCNDFSAEKLTQYGMAKIPNDDLFVAAVSQNATIKIAGSSDLGMCTAILTPSLNAAAKTIEWKCAMQKTEKNGDSLQKCRQYVYGCES